mgnify:CR=1 FL=1
MSENLDPLVLDLVEWIAQKPQPYAHVIDVCVDYVGRDGAIDMDDVLPSRSV